MQVTAVTHRANPVYPAMVPGEPPDEVCVIRRALGRIFLPLTRSAIPDLLDCDLPEFGAARHWALVSIRKAYAGHARCVAHALWGQRHTMFTKLLVLVDDDVDVRDHQQVWSAVAAHTDLGRDVFSHQGPPDPWDPATDLGSPSHRMAIDATRKLPEETRGNPTVRPRRTEEIIRLVTERWQEYGLASDDTS
jgi:4-hydroxy-3-polyprenylbenzoate decarboxylase